MTASISKLYRQYLRQVRQLPVLYLRQFFGLKAADDARAIARTSDPLLFRRKLRRVMKDISKMETANAGNVKSFAHLLDLAYGRKGKLKQELMEPFLSDPDAQPPQPVIPSVKKSRPPVYSPELRALLTSALSRTTKPLKFDSLNNLPQLPTRADPTSEEAHLLGAFSKRREVNLRWRYFTAEWKKVLPPLHSRNLPKGSLVREDQRLQGTEVFRDIELLVGPLQKPVNLTRRELQVQRLTAPAHACHHQSRWLRRRYQQLLARIPILDYAWCHDFNSEHPQKTLTVTISPNASSPSLRYSADRLPVASSADIEWLSPRLRYCTRRTERQRRDDNLSQSKLCSH